MAKTLYFKAQIGDKIYFRQSPTRVYLSVIPQKHSGVSFSAKPGAYPTVQISKAEFDVLNARKMERLGSSRYVSPSDSWVGA